MQNKQNLYKNIFYDKKVLITGPIGFKGSWLSIWLNHLRAKVYGISENISTKPPNFIANKLCDFLSDYKADIWFSFQGVQNPFSLINNVSNLIHDDKEVEIKELHSVNYIWENPN